MDVGCEHKLYLENVNFRTKFYVHRHFQLLLSTPETNGFKTSSIPLYKRHISLNKKSTYEKLHLKYSLLLFPA